MGVGVRPPTPLKQEQQKGSVAPLPEAGPSMPRTRKATRTTTPATAKMASSSSSLPTPPATGRKRKAATAQAIEAAEEEEGQSPSQAKRQRGKAGATREKAKTGLWYVNDEREFVMRDRRVKVPGETCIGFMMRGPKGGLGKELLDGRAWRCEDSAGR